MAGESNCRQKFILLLSLVLSKLFVYRTCVKSMFPRRSIRIFGSKLRDLICYAREVIANFLLFTVFRYRGNSGRSVEDKFDWHC